jgi:hypothetical protein
MAGFCFIICADFVRRRVLPELDPTSSLKLSILVNDEMMGATVSAKRYSDHAFY